MSKQAQDRLFDIGAICWRCGGQETTTTTENYEYRKLQVQEEGKSQEMLVKCQEVRFVSHDPVVLQYRFNMFYNFKVLRLNPIASKKNVSIVCF